MISANATMTSSRPPPRTVVMPFTLTEARASVVVSLVCSPIRNMSFSNTQEGGHERKASGRGESSTNNSLLSPFLRFVEWRRRAVGDWRKPVKYLLNAGRNGALGSHN